MDESPLNNPHDAFVKTGLGEPRQMASFLQAYLPSELAAAVDWTSLEARSTDFLDEQLHRRHADLLFAARFDGKPIFFHLLFEHQKSADRWMPLRLLTYQVRIWEDFRKTKPEAKQLPAILPIVFFQDQGEWHPSPQFRDLLELPTDLDPAWLEYLPQFKHATVNLSGLPLDAVRDNIALKTMLKVLRAILDPDPAHSFESGLRALLELIDAPDQQTFLRVCLTYLTEAGNTLDQQTLYGIISEVKSPHLKNQAMTIAQQLRQEGQLEGERLFLERLLTRKFGELSYHNKEQLGQADRAALELWGERILEAKTLEEVFSGF